MAVVPKLFEISGESTLIRPLFYIFWVSILHKYPLNHMPETTAGFSQGQCLNTGNCSLIYTSTIKSPSAVQMSKSIKQTQSVKYIIMHMYKHTFTHIHPYTYKYTYICTYTCMYAYTHIYIYTYIPQHVNPPNINVLCMGGGARCSG